MIKSGLKKTRPFRFLLLKSVVDSLALLPPVLSDALTLSFSLYLFEAYFPLTGPHVAC